MSSESLGGRGDRALLSFSVTTIFCILKNMIDSGGRYPLPLKIKKEEGKKIHNLFNIDSTKKEGENFKRERSSTNSKENIGSAALQVCFLIITIQG